MMTIFSRIVKGEIPCHKIAETDDCFAFLDIQPLATGHILVIPKLEVDYIFDVADDIYAKLWQFAKRVSIAQQHAIACKRIGIAVIGLEVPHAHIHLIPLNTVNDINFSLPKMNPTPDELSKTAELIRSFFNMNWK
ncbi:MAG: HIT family protein [Bacteroidetes bacterium]|nr:HIT family protein [Bacteroidota bacterium]